MSATRKLSISPFLRRQSEIEQLLFNNHQWNTLISLYSKQIINYDYCENSQIRNNKKFIMKLCSQWPNNKHHFVKSSDLTREQFNDREIVKILLKRNGYVLEYLNDQFRNDRELVEMTLCQSGNYLRYFSEELRGNFELVMMAVKKSGSALEFASEDLRNNVEIVSQAVSNDGMALKFASDELKRDEKLVFKAVSNNGDSLQFADEELRNNYRIVMKAVSQFGQSLKYASPTLKSNKKIAMAAIKQGCSFVTYCWNEPIFDPVLQYVGEDLIQDRQFLMKALKYEGVFIYSWKPSSDYWNNPEIILACFKSRNPPVGFVGNPDVSEELRNDVKFMKKLHKYSKGTISKSFFPINTFKEEKKLNKVNVSMHDKIDMNLLKNDRKVIKDIFEKGFLTTTLSNSIMSNISEELKDDREFMQELVSLNSLAFDSVSNRLKNDIEFVRNVIQKDGYLLQHAGEELWKDRDLTLIAIQNGLSSYCIHESLVTNIEIISEFLARS